jgi:cytochrome c peroxidase
VCESLQHSCRTSVPAARPALLLAMLSVVIAIPAADAAGNAVAGKGRFGLCEACHGVRAEGNADLGAPALAGLQGWYVARQLAAFASGQRGSDPGDKYGRQMQSMAQAASAPDSVADLVAHIETLQPTQPSATVRGDATRGKSLYETCKACHGDRAEGNAELQAPALAHNHDWYLLRQLQNFKAGRRGSAQGDSSGAQMAAMAATLPDEQALHDVVAYIATLREGSAWQLNGRCPPSFEQIADGTCEFRNLYELYASAAGHGGLRARLPQMRERFTPEQIDLGRYLFFDRALSGEGLLACADCHDPDRGFADGRIRSLGRVELDRNAPTLWNVGFLPRLFWDGRSRTLEEQARGPLFSAAEMANTPEQLEATLNDVAAYRRLFAHAFRRDERQPIRVDEVTLALAAFESSLVSFNSRYDRYALGDANALTDQEQHGYNIFRGFVGRCSQCHIPPLFTDGELAVVGAPPVAGRPYDVGAGRTSDDPALVGAFKVPTLRNVARTAPYFNAGQLSSLDEVLRFYNDARGHARPPGITQQIHWHIAMPRPLLSEEDVAAVVAFLGALTDESLRPSSPQSVPSGRGVGGIAPKTLEACGTCQR